MTNAARTREILDVEFRHKTFTLTQGEVAWKGARLLLNLTTGRVIRGVSAAGHLPIGRALEDVDATVAAKPIEVDLLRHVVAEWLANAPGAEAVTQVGSICYTFDDSTVTATSTNRTYSGRVWEISASKGVLVEHLQEIVTIPEARVKVVNAAFAFTSNNYAPTVAQLPPSDSVQPVGTTAAASTVTLPDEAPEGYLIHFQADGVTNGHTVTYRQANAGTPVNRTSALTASRVHIAHAQFAGGVWSVDYTVSAA